MDLSPNLPAPLNSGRKKLELFRPTCNIDTVRDGRGGIFTWVPPETIAEFNMLYFTPGSTRGNHYHPEFVEYIMVVEGTGVMVTREDENSPNEIIHMSKGDCTRCPKGVVHAFYAITPVTAIALITKPWDLCNPPIVRLDVMNSPCK